MNEIYEKLNINPNIVKLVLEEEKKLTNEFAQIDYNEAINSAKVIQAFWNEKISESHFNGSSGYGYSDIGRDAIEKVFADVLGGEASLVRNQFISGTHAITTCLFALLRPNDTLLSISGMPYDTIQKVIGIKENASSLKSFGINYEQIDLIDNDFDYEKIEKTLKEDFIKVVEIQRSKGYSNRKSINLDKVEKVIKLIKSVSPKTIVMIDNCYCEFVTKQEPTEVGADIVVGSLIKNLGGGIAQNGAYIVGREDLVDLCGERLTLPGEGMEVGPSLGANRNILQGLALAPSVVKSALKTAVFTSKIMEDLGYEVEPKYNEERVDIVQNIIFKDEEKLIKYCQGIQNGSLIDSFATPVPDAMPGYDNKVIMAAGCFTQGSSIELSCDGPIKYPYIAYQQGALTYEYGKLGVINAIKNL